MKASIIIPAYNEEKYIAKTLEAVMVLDYPDYEVIVADNCSTDNTKQIVSSFKNVILVDALNRGSSFARQEAWKNATGDIIVQLDADCIPNTNWLKKGVSYFKDERISGVYGAYYYYDANIFLRYFTYILGVWIMFPFSQFMNYFSKTKATALGGNFFIRASAMSKAGGYDTSILFYGDDTDTAKRIKQYGRIVYDPFLFVKSSCRRFTKLGFFKTMYLYISNNMYVNIFNKPCRNKYSEPV